MACKRNHIDAERDARGNCRQCARERARERYAANPSYQKQWLRDNADRHRANVAAYRARNPEAERERGRAHRTANPRKMAHDAAMQRAKALSAVPAWADRKAIRQVYDACPVGMEVDHVLPLKSDIVCGLHVPSNLQYLTRSENARKNNRVEA